LRRQARISDPVVQGSDSRLEDTLKPINDTEDATLVGRTSSCCSDSRLGVDYFQSFEEDEPSEILADGKSKSQVISSKAGHDELEVEHKKVVLQHLNSKDHTMTSDFTLCCSSDGRTVAHLWTLYQIYRLFQPCLYRKNAW